MWFEAKKQERKIRSIMVDHKKRAERRQDFYEKIKRDPAEFMQLHGSKCKIQLDPNVSKATESSSLRPWRGDSDNLMDRFDARAHLDFIPEYKAPRDDSDSDSENETEETRRTDYERYRILVVNDFEKTSEEKFLKQIYMEERHGVPANQTSKIAKQEAEKKKKTADKKAAIAFTYDDGCETPNKGNFAKKEESSESSSDEDSEPEFEVTLNVEELNPEDVRNLDKIAAKYKIKSGDFVRYMGEDKEEQAVLDDIKKEEEAKAALSGKKSRRERQLLKQERLLLISGTRDFTTRLSFARKESPGRKDIRSSSSRSPSVERKPGKIEFITSFGGEQESDEGDSAPVQGPAAPPPEYMKLLALRKRKSESPNFGPEDKSMNKRRKTRSKSRSREKSSARRSSRRGGGGERDKYASSQNSRRHRSRSRSQSRNRRDKRSRSMDRHRRRRRSSSSTSSDRSQNRRRSSYRSKKEATTPSTAKTSFETGNPVVKQDEDAKMMQPKAPIELEFGKANVDLPPNSSLTVSNAVGPASIGKNVGDQAVTEQSKWKSLPIASDLPPSIDPKSGSDVSQAEAQQIPSDVPPSYLETTKPSTVSSVEEAPVNSPKFRKRSEDTKSSSSSDRSERRRDSSSSESDGSSGMLSIRSSLSESETERREVENRRRRIQRTKRNARLKSGKKWGDNSKNGSRSSTDPADKGKLSVLEKLKIQTQKALKKTVARDKEEELERRREMMRSQIERDEEMRELGSLMRKKEREKRAQAMEEYERLEKLHREERRSARHSRRRSRSRSGSADSRRRRRHSRRSRSRSAHRRKRSKSSERSSSRTDTKTKLVDY